MRLIILEDANGKRRYIVPGKTIKPPRSSQEKIVGLTLRESDAGCRSDYKFKRCSACGLEGVYEYF